MCSATRQLTRAAALCSIAGNMPELSTGEQKRRSSRIFARLVVPLAGKNAQGRKFREVCRTVVVNAHGALLYTTQTLEMSAILNVTSPATQEEMECRVVFLGDNSDRGQRIGIEFLAPAPHFWGIEFPDDWTPPAPPAEPTVH